MRWKAPATALLICAPIGADAQNYIDETSNYAEKIQARRIAPLESNTAFGAHISYLDGSTSVREQ